MSSFDFITDEWLDLQTWLTKIRTLPSTPADFDTRYGTFDDTADSEATEAALISAQQVALKLGGPADVQRQLAAQGDYLSSNTPPAMIYGRLVWWTLRVGAASTAVKHQVETIASLISGKQASPDDIRSLVSGDHGLDGLVREVASAGSELSTAVGNLRDQLLPQITVFAGTKMLAEANQVIGGLSAELEKLNAQAAQDYAAWKHETLAPGDNPPPIDVTGPSDSTSVGFHWPWSRHREDEAKADYAAVLAKIEALETEEKPKAQFLADAQGLDIAATGVAPALDQLRSGIGKVVGCLQAFTARCAATVMGSEDQLSDSAWVLHALEVHDVEVLADDARRFTTEAFVETHVPPPGDAR
jgi:hypothetical protein